MLFALKAGIKHPYERTFAWCYSVRDKTCELRDRRDGGMDIIAYPAPVQAHFEGGRVWPDIAANGSGYRDVFFSDAAIQVLQHYDPKAICSPPIEITFRPNKSLSRTGPPAYRIFSPSLTIPRNELVADADSPALFRIAGYSNRYTGCTEYVKRHVEASKLRNFEFEPLFDLLDRIDRMRTKHR